MKRCLLLLTLMLGTVACARAGAKAGGQAAANDHRPALTIYNGNFAVVREHLPLSLTPGVNRMQYNGITARLEPDSVMLRDPAGLHALQILEQSYRNDPISQELLLSRYEGKTLDFLVERGKGPEIIKGKIIRSGYVSAQGYPNYGGYPQSGLGQPIIEVDGVLRFGLPGQPLFPALAADSLLKPALSWLLNTDTAGQFDAELSYVTGGMSWQADYNLVIAESGAARSSDLLDLLGWVTMRNQSGKTFEDARIKLMAGDVSKIQAGSAGGMLREAESKAMARDQMRPAVAEKSFDEFHLYTLERPATLHDQESKQVEFIRAAGIRSQRVYVYDGARIDANRYNYMTPDQVRQDYDYGTLSNPKIWVMQEFQNSQANHLGIPLPKGRLRFYRRDTDGHLEFIGENTIDHTPKDETVRVYTGNAFDLTGERRRTNFKIDTGQKWADESFEIKVRNHKKEAVNLRVVEHLYRCLEWKITQESHDHRKTEAQTMEFRVPLPPGGEQVITYTVHYSW